MAELEIGKQCSVLSCKQLDFLPFTCSDCNEIFCLEHRSTTSHNCFGKTEIVTPEQRNTEVSIKIRCNFEGCGVGELLPVKCDLCHGQFCLRHRHQRDHGCPKIEETSKSLAAAKEKSLIEKKAKIGRGGMKNYTRAAKVALMKMKMQAVGDSSIPQEERVFFSIKLPQEQKDKSMFFSKKWSVGRTIDEIAMVCKLKNENNKKISKKLRLFDGFSGKQLIIGNSLEIEMNENPETMLNGSVLVMKYVEESS